MIRSRESLVGAWAFLIGIILALIIGIVGKLNPIILGVLSVLGLILGYFVTEKDSHTFLLAAVVLVIVSFMGIQGLVLSAAILGVNIGKIISTVLGALLVLFVPATVVVALKMVFSISKS